MVLNKKEAGGKKQQSRSYQQRLSRFLGLIDITKLSNQ